MPSSFDYVCIVYDSNETIAYHLAYPLGVGKLMGSILGKNRVLAKDVKSYTYVAMSDARHY